VSASSHTIDGLQVTFDDDNAVANAGLMLPATLAAHLGAEELIDDCVDLGDHPGAPNAGRKALTVIVAMLAGAVCIDDVNVLRAGSTGRVLPFEVAAPSTVGTFLRGFTFGHVRQLDRAAEQLLTRAWAAGAGPGEGEPVVIDLDSTVCEVHGHDKHGAAYGYTGVLGYHPMIATLADGGEVVHARMRKGSANTGRGAQRFVREVAGRVRRAGADGPIVLRADSGYWSQDVIDACDAHDIAFSITVRRTKTVVAAIESIDDEDWVTLADYPNPGVAQVAATDYKGVRLIVRRVRNENDDARLFDLWRHHAFVTNRAGDPITLDVEHRAHAVQEQIIRELKGGTGLARCPSGNFNANGAWLVLATLAHNLARWTVALGLRTRALIAAKTLRARLFSLPGRLVTSGRRTRLRLPARWPWADDFLAALHRLRAVPAPT
jgi:hypothetical protein